MDNKNIESFYPLSPMQQGMLFHSLFAPESGVYVEQLRSTLQGKLDVSAFQQTWQRLVDRHPILRSAFVWEGLKEPVQVVRREAPVALEQQDWRGLSVDEQQQRLAAFAVKEQTTGFDLAVAPLIRLALLRTADDTYEFVWTHHHILLDGWSVPLLLGELFTIYDSLSRGLEPQLPQPRPFRDYIVWLRRQNLDEAEDYWRQALKGFTAPTPLVATRNWDPSQQGQRSNEPDGQPAELEINLSATATASLESLARQHRLTLNTLVLGAWATLLSRYSGEQDVCCGVTVSGRPANLPGAETMLGLFINTLPMRLQVPADRPVVQWLQEVQAQQAEMRQFEYSPLAQVQGWSDAPRGVPLFDSIFVFENLPVGAAASGQRAGELEIRNIHSSSHTNYPLTVVAVPDREMLLKIGYDASRFNAATIERMMAHMQNLLVGFATNPQEAPLRVPMTSPRERQMLLHPPVPQLGIGEWAVTPASFPASRTIHRWVEEQAARTPNAVAVNLPTDQDDTGPGPALTYAELNRRANQLAHALRRLGVGPETLIALYVERSLEMVVGILGILKAGGAYVPMDPAYPPERLAYLVEDTKAPLVLTQKAMADTASAFSMANAKVLCLDSDWPTIEQEDDQNLASNASPDTTAYVIYTSGSTGKPKGVMVTHANVVRLFEATEAWYNFHERDVWTLFHSYAFDFSVWELWGALFYGGRLVVVPYLVSRSPDLFYRLLCREGVTVLNQTPSAFRQLIRAEETIGQCPELALRYVIFGGEALELESLRPWYQRHGDRCPLLVNMYGITETTVHVTYRPLSLADVDAGTGSVIGVPIPDLQVYILDQLGQLAPVGVPGEIYVGGAGLARGYLNRPDLTEQRFIATSSVPDLELDGHESSGLRLYRSGDLARWLPNGDLEYLGRIDHQVKIRGFRIELGEIETVLTQHPSVRETIVLAREDATPEGVAAGGRDGAAEPGHKRLVAYFVATTPDAVPTVAELRAFLGEKLPAYMVPSAFVPMEQLPLTTHGKVDRRALPAPDDGRLDLGTNYVAPRTPQEEEMAAIWARLLNVERVGVQDNFFQLGGDSILSLQVISRAKQVGMEFTPRQLFEHPTIAELMTALDSTVSSQAEQGLVTGPVPLTPVQHWFFEQHPDAPHHFNTSMMLITAPDLDEAALQAAVRQLLTHHDALRLQFDYDGSSWHQTLTGLPETLPYTRIDLPGATPDAIEARAAEIQASFDLKSGPLFQVVYFRRGGPDTQMPGRLLICLHHLVGDGVSWRVLLEDLVVSYEQARRNLPLRLPSKTTSYQAWANHLVAYARSQALKSEASRWTRIGTLPLQPLPMAHPEGRNTYGSTEEITVSLDRQMTQDLLQTLSTTFGADGEKGPQRTAVEEVLLTALVRAFAPWTGTRRLLIEMEGHGREEIAAGLDLSRTVGWFTSIYPVLIDLEEAQDLASQLRVVRQQLQAVPHRGIDYGVLRYLCDDSELRRQMATLPTPQVNFNYLGQVVPAAAGDELEQTLLVGLAPESPGPEQSPSAARSALLYVVGIVTDGSLDMRWLYSREVFERSTIELVANTTMNELRAIIGGSTAGHADKALQSGQGGSRHG